MKKIEKYELIYSRSVYATVLLGFVYDIISKLILKTEQEFYTSFYVDIIFLISFFLMSLSKYIFIKKGSFDVNPNYLIFRFMSILAVCISIVFIGIGQWAFVLIALAILVTSLNKGNKYGLIIVLISFVTITVLYFIKALIWPDFVGHLLAREAIFVLFSNLVLVLFALICGQIYKDSQLNEIQNKELLGQLEEKYDQLSVAQEEIKYQYEKLKDSNNKLEEANGKLVSSVAEFYTLQQISQAISSIFNINELLKYMNDIIIGVMGVTTSSIILFDEKSNRLRIHTTNIKNREELATINDNLNCRILLDVLDTGKAIIESFVDPEQYVFAKGRNINSLICVPLSSKSKKFGLVLIEHQFDNAFDEENLRLLDIIGQQVGIAMENAELYQKMEELATVDGLSGVFNRLYFNERLQKEFDNARRDDYTLSIAIFDIDFFKKFNDTFGHLFGDKVISAIADVARNSLRKSDVIARYGGEEFVILFPRTSLSDAAKKVEDLRRNIEKTIVKDELVTASVTVSIGVSAYPECALTENELLKSADSALYMAKGSGRNCIEIAETKYAEINFQ